MAAAQFAAPSGLTGDETTRIVEFPRGLLGFEVCTRFTLLTRPDWHPFARLQCLDDPELAFVVADPRVFVPHYKVEVDPREIAELDVDDVRQVAVWVLVTVVEDPMQVSINLQGPLLLNRENNRGKQLVMVHSTYASCHDVLGETRCPDARRTGTVARRLHAAV